MEKEKFFGNLIAGTFVVLFLASFYYQVVRYWYYLDQSKRQAYRTIDEGTPRGEIRDRNDRVLVRDIECFNLIFFPHDLRNPIEAAAEVARITGLEYERVKEAFTRTYRNPFDRIILKKRLSPEERARIMERVLYGVEVYAGRDREYVLGDKCAHVIGYVGEFSSEEMPFYRPRGFKPGDEIGKQGLEKMYDDFLRGISGGVVVRVDALGHHRQVVGKTSSKPGNSLVLTIDQTLQEIASEELGSTRGCVVAMDPNNGQILAMVSRPAFDPSAVARALGKPGDPFLNRAIQGAYPPGSIFKIVTEIAALESGAIDEHTRIECTGSMVVGDRPFRCWKQEGHGWLDIDLALPFSCNIFFGTVGMRTGQEKLVEYARQFRLGMPTGIDLPGERRGDVPLPNAPAELSGGPLQLAIGQGSLTTTPLQLASLIATVANGGNIWKPYVVRRILNEKNEVVRETSPFLQGTVFISPETLDILKRGLKNVVAFGTGGGARLKEVEVCGKTGTAQRGTADSGMKTMGSFACYAPAERPSVAMVVCLDEGASPEAARIAGRILRRVFTATQDETFNETEFWPREEG